MTRLLYSAFVEFIKTAFLTALVFISIDGMEFWYAISQLGQDLSFILFVERSVNFDVLFVFFVFSCFCIPVTLIGAYSFSASRSMAGLFAVVLILCDLMLTIYLLGNQSLLSCVLFEFSLTDVLSIIANEFTANRLLLWLVFVLFLVLTVITFTRLLPAWKMGKKGNALLSLAYLVIAVVTVINSPPRIKEIRHFENRFQYYLGNSKMLYLWQTCESRKTASTETDQNIETVIQQYQSVASGFDYVSSEYPFLHTTPNTNVLGQFFKKDSIAPNIVIVISESMSASFFPEHSNEETSALMPFTDSLARSGLYWSNFFSNAERSYGAIPNILGSLPYGDKDRGFMNMKYEYATLRNYPVHENLISMLNENRYVSSYFYGSWGGFDNVNTYLKESGIDNFFSDDAFDKSIYESKSASWGYNDKALFNQSFSLFDSLDSDLPFLNIYQTISLHTPYNLAEEKYFEDSFLKKKLEDLNISERNPMTLRDEVLATIFFADDALRDFFRRFQLREDYENTIFIVTGDHGMDLGMGEHVFENFKVPLIIYSPLLTKNLEFKGACSHIDILPSLVALLSDNFGLQFQSDKHWIGQGLDTSKDYNFERVIPMKIGSNDLPNMIVGDTLIYANSLWAINQSLELTSVADSDTSRAKTLYKSYVLVNDHVCRTDRIWKD